MKLSKLYPLMLLLMAVLLFSCSNNNPTFYEVVSGEEKKPDDGGTSGNGEGAQLILENLIIKGSVITKGNGVTTKLPKISNTFDFVVPKYGFLKNGFPIKFSKGSDIPTGIYIQIKTTGGKLSKGHTVFMLDSDIEEFNYVHFSDEIKTGDFCVVLYFLTAKGLTDPIEFCIEVPAWGGDHKLTGDWEIYYNYEFYDGKKNIYYKDKYTSFLEEEKKYDCESGGSVVSFLSRDIISDSKWLFNKNGDLHFLNEITSESLNLEKTKNTCAQVWEVVTGDEEYEEVKGKWFYDKKKAVMYMVSFETREGTKDDFESSKYGDLSRFKVVKEIKGFKLIMIEADEDKSYEYAYGIRTH